MALDSGLIRMLRGTLEIQLWRESRDAVQLLTNGPNGQSFLVGIVSNAQNADRPRIFNVAYPDIP